MKDQELRFSGSVPASYDRLMVPLLFRPYAEELARRARTLRPRRILETAAGTGAVTEALHAALAAPVLSAHVDRLILIGEEMRALDEALGDRVPVDRVETVDEATDALRRIVRPGDAVLVKASNSVGLAKLVGSMAKELACST